MQQGDRKPVEGYRTEAPAEAQTPTRTGDNEPQSDVTGREVKAMTGAPLIFIAVAVLLFVGIMVAVAVAVFGGTGAG